MSRVERLLKAIIQNGSYDEERLSRVEDILYSFLKDNEYTEDPMSRMEALLITLKNSGAYSDDILSRIEAILKAKIDGTEYPYEPRSRVEELLLIWDVISEYEVYVTGIPPLTLKNSVGKDLLEWSITGNTEQNWKPKPSNIFDKSLWMRDGDSAIYDNSDGTFAIRTVPYQERKNRYNIPDNTKDYCLSFSMRWDTSSYADRIKFRITGIKTDGTEETVKEFSYFAGTQKVSVIIPANTYSAFAFGGWAYEGSIIISNIGLNEGTIPYDEFNLSEIKGTGDKTANLLDMSEWFKKLKKSPREVFNGTIQYIENGLILTATGNDCYTGHNVGYAYTIPVEPNTTYTLSWKTDTNKIGLVYIFQNNSTSGDYKKNVRSTDGQLTFTTFSDVSYIAFRVGIQAAGDSIKYTDFMLNEGSEPLPYEPYGYKVPVVTRGKNLWNPNDVDTKWCKTDLTIEVSTTSRSIIKKCESEKVYTLSYKADKIYYGVLAFLDADNNVLSRKVNTTDNFVFSVAPKNAKYVFASIYMVDDNAFDIQLELGSTATEYEPYIEPIATPIYLPSPLMADEVLDFEGKREVEWGEYEFTGGEHINLYTSFGGKGIRMNIPDMRIGKYQIGYCSHCVSATDGRIGEMAFGSNNSDIYWFGIIDILEMSNIDEFKQWLKSEYDKGTPVTIFYPLATPTSEIVTVPQIPTVEGTNIISAETEVQPKNMTVTYLSSEKSPDGIPLRTGDGEILYTADNEPL